VELAFRYIPYTVRTVRWWGGSNGENFQDSLRLLLHNLGNRPVSFNQKRTGCQTSLFRCKLLVPFERFESHRMFRFATDGTQHTDRIDYFPLYIGQQPHAGP